LIVGLQHASGMTAGDVLEASGSSVARVATISGHLNDPLETEQAIMLRLEPKNVAHAEATVKIATAPVLPDLTKAKLTAVVKGVVSSFHNADRQHAPSNTAAAIGSSETGINFELAGLFDSDSDSSNSSWSNSFNSDTVALTSEDEPPDRLTTTYKRARSALASVNQCRWQAGLAWSAQTSTH
jgi:hypothetical protein